MSIFHAAIVVAVLGANTTRENVEFTEDTLEVVRENVSKEDAVLVDVRSLEEWNEGHIEDSLFLPVTSIRKRKYPAEMTEDLPKDKILYTFCVVGMRAKKAAAPLRELGYDVRALKPGFKELLKAGFEQAEE
jgi:rhodanese-related sulfurtransferase